MPRGPKGERRPADVIGNAVKIGSGQFEISGVTRGLLRCDLPPSRGSIAGCRTPGWLCLSPSTNSIAGRGFRLIRQTTRALPTGKGFWAGIFSAPEAHHRK